VITRLERDPGFPPLGVADARRVLSLLPSPGELGRRLSGLSRRRFHEVLEGLEQGCQLIEAVVDGTLPASVRQRRLAQALGRHLPNSECFALYGVDLSVRQSWVRWLFLSRRGKRA
jgi:hypothetical protein